VTASVLVQVLPSVAETGEFLAVAASGTVVAGVVGWADLTAPDVAESDRSGCASFPAGTGWPACGTWSRTSRIRTGWTGRTCAAACAP